MFFFFSRKRNTFFFSRKHYSPHIPDKLGEEGAEHGEVEVARGEQEAAPGARVLEGGVVTVLKQQPVEAVQDLGGNRGDKYFIYQIYTNIFLHSFQPIHNTMFP